MSNLVTVNWEKATEALLWAKENCPDFIRRDYHQDGYETFDVNHYDFFFAEGSADITTFALRWT